MRCLYIILANITIIFFAFGQNQIKGRILSVQNGKPVPNAVVTLFPKGESSIITYTATDDKGFFMMDYKTSSDSITITVAAMTIESQSKTVTKNKSYIEFLVKDKVNKIKEVIVKAPKIRQRGDTINYYVASYLDPTDRTIGDVLRKLPGIQVLSSGQILYQNKEISKFYVEGLDLLQGKYGLATKNLDVSKVATVQILENHQPIKALKGMEIPETAAINLKLNKSALGAFFAIAQAGVGLSPLLQSNEAIGMRFTRKQQNMLIYKGDNTGRDISEEMTSYYGLLENASVDFLSVITPVPPEIKEQHYLFNDAHLGSVNDLRTLKNDLTLTTNINYLFDKQKSSSYSKRNIFLNQSDTLSIDEDLNAHMYKRELESAFTLEKNVDNAFLNNTLRVNSSWNSINSAISSNDPVGQFLKRPSFNIGNNFEYLKRHDNRRRQITAEVGYQSESNTLRISPVLFEDLQTSDSMVRQLVTFDRFNANVAMIENKNYKRINFGYTTGIEVNSYFVKSNLESGEVRQPLMADSLRNKINRTESKVIFAPSLIYTAPYGTQLSINIPVKYLFLMRNDKIRNQDHDGSYLLFSPRVSFFYPIGARWKLNLRSSYSNGIGNIDEDYRGYILKNYRSLNSNSGMLSKISTTLASIKMDYKNPFSSLFMSLEFSYNNLWRNTLYDVQYNDILSRTVSIRYPYHTHICRVDYSIGKTLTDLHSEVGLRAFYNHNKSLALAQGLISGYQSGSYFVSSNITTHINRFVVVKYDGSYQHSRSTIREEKMDPINYFTQDISTSFIPVKQLTISLSLNHYYNDRLQSSSRSKCFGNMTVRYKMKKVEFIVDYTNVFNAKRFITYSYNDISSYYSMYDLRPAEILLRVRFKLF